MVKGRVASRKNVIKRLLGVFTLQILLGQIDLQKQKIHAPEEKDC